MTDITINIKTGSKNSKPKVTTTIDNAKTVVPKTESPKAETPKEETKEVTTSEKESPKDEIAKKDESQKMPALSSDRDMTEEEHAKMGSKKD